MPEMTLKAIFSKGWFNSIQDGTLHIIPMLVHFLISCIVVTIIIYASILLNNTRNTPANDPTGYSTVDYNVQQTSRAPFSNMLVMGSTQGGTTNTIATYPDTTPMSYFQVATANFGGIFTEASSALNPWLGYVSTNAITLQVEAGARAVIFDVWPDPANPSNPIIASMVDVTKWYYQNQWASPGNMNKGVGEYSNWNYLTRNMGSLSDILTAATNAAFNGLSSQQNSDPFFIILNLHGAMSASYLNLVGTIVQAAVGGHAMGSEWTLSSNNNAQIQNAPVSQFAGRAFVIANPDIQPGIGSLLDVNTLEGFLNTVLPAQPNNFNPYSSFLNAVNLIPLTSQQLLYRPDALSAVKTAAPTSLTAGLPIAIIQPSIGAPVTNNDALFGLSGTSYTECMKSNAQFVGINLFTSGTTDSGMSTFLDATNGFGKYSFKYIGPSPPTN